MCFRERERESKYSNGGEIPNTQATAQVHQTPFKKIETKNDQSERQRMVGLLRWRWGGGAGQGGGESQWEGSRGD